LTAVREPDGGRYPEQKISVHEALEANITIVDGRVVCERESGI
jgi:hypothetical protein